MAHAIGEFEEAERVELLSTQRSQLLSSQRGTNSNLKSSTNKVVKVVPVTTSDEDALQSPNDPPANKEDAAQAIADLAAEAAEAKEAHALYLETATEVLDRVDPKCSLFRETLHSNVQALVSSLPFVILYYSIK